MSSTKRHRALELQVGRISQTTLRERREPWRWLRVSAVLLALLALVILKPFGVVLHVPGDGVDVEVVAVAVRQLDHVEAVPVEPRVDVVLLEEALHWPQVLVVV
jgi:hypothetical protein